MNRQSAGRRRGGHPPAPPPRSLEDRETALLDRGWLKAAGANLAAIQLDEHLLRTGKSRFELRYDDLMAVCAVNRWTAALLALSLLAGCSKSKSGADDCRPFDGSAALAGVEVTKLETPLVGLGGVFFLSPDVGYVVGWKGTILKTTDGGQHWQTQESGTTMPLNAVFFGDEQTGYAAGGCKRPTCRTDASILLKTMDGGESWVEWATPLRSPIMSLAFLSADHGFAAADSDLAETFDGGQTWDEVPALPAVTWLSLVRFVDDRSGFALAHNGLLTTRDAGRTWIRTGLPSAPLTYGVDFVSPEVGYAAGQGKMRKTIDGGQTWTELSESPVGAYAVHFVDERVGVAVGPGCYTGGDFGQMRAAVHRTDDGGATWVTNPRLPLGYQGRTTHFPTKHLGFVTWGGALLRITVK